MKGEAKRAISEKRARKLTQRIVYEKDEDCIGFATLPDQMHRKVVKRGFHFSIMVVGESGLGKSTLINSLFMADLYKDRQLTGTEDKFEVTVQLNVHHVDIEERGVKLRLSVIDTPGFADGLNGEESIQPIEQYIDRQFMQYLQAENGLNRKNIQDQDSRVHCVLYFISPYGHGLRPMDIELMRRLHKKVNIVPLIAKADTLTSTELRKMKRKVLDDIEEHEISIYDLPDCDSDEDDSFKEQDAALKAAVPFAVVGSNSVTEVNGKRVRARIYPWGMVEVERSDYSDFTKLRKMLLGTHLQDLKDVTEEVHYENFRANQILTKENNNNSRSHSETNQLQNQDSVDQLLLEKEKEIQKMQQMLAAMQRQMSLGTS